MAETPAQQQYPNLNPYADSNGTGSSLENTKNAVINSKYSESSPPSPTSPTAAGFVHSSPNTILQTDAQQTMDSFKNSQTVQSIANGPMADKARAEADTTRNEFGNLAAARQTPSTQTANGQNLTHYHSFFYSLLSWENPRATALSYVTTALVILLARYFPLSRYALKAAWTLLGITAAAEIVGKLALGEGFASKIRPRKYYTIPHETLEQILGDIEELINFFVIEFQRIVFAENVFVTVAAFFSSLVSYFLVKIMPTWGLILLFTTFAYFAPLVYITNQELIDHHINNAHTIVNEQANQVRDLATQHTNKAYEVTQSQLKDYTAKAQDLIGQGKKAAVEKGIVSPETAEKVVPDKAVQSEDFPSAPKQEPAGAHIVQTEPHTAEPVAA